MPYPEILNNVLPNLHQPILLQTQLGWAQLFYREFSREWAKSINKIHPQLPIPGEQIILTMVKKIWAYFLEVWKIQTAHLQPQQCTPTWSPKLQASNNNPVQTETQALPTGTGCPLQTTTWTYPGSTPTRLQKWVIQGYKYFTQQLKAKKKQAAIGTSDIRTFFQHTTQHPGWSPPPMRWPCYTILVWVFFVHHRHREITLKCWVFSCICIQFCFKPY